MIEICNSIYIPWLSFIYDKMGKYVFPPVFPILRTVVQTQWDKTNFEKMYSFLTTKLRGSSRYFVVVLHTVLAIQLFTPWCEWLRTMFSLVNHCSQFWFFWFQNLRVSNYGLILGFFIYYHTDCPFSQFPSTNNTTLTTVTAPLKAALE